MSNRALVVNPWVTDFKLYDEWMHPLGLYFLISLLDYNKWDICYINCLQRKVQSKQKKYCTGNFRSKTITRPDIFKNIPRTYKKYGISKKTFHRHLESIPGPDIIFVGSGMTYWIKGLEITLNSINEIFPSTPVIVGGISATLIPHVLKAKFPKIKVFSGPLFSQIIKFRKLHPKLTTINSNGWIPSIKDTAKYIKNYFHGPLITSFGCPLSCTYCASSHLQDKFRIRNQRIVIEEIEYLLKKYSITDFAFYDDALLYNYKTNFIPLTKELSVLNSKIRLHAPNGLHIRWINRPVLEAMKNSGFTTLRFGFETSGNRSRSDYKYFDETYGKTTKKILSKKIKLITSFGYNSKDIGVYVMAGLPEQTMQDVFSDMDFIASLRIKVKPVFLSPVPFTKCYEYYSKIIPDIRNRPLLHNDTFFITLLKEWDYSKIECIKKRAQKYNLSLSSN